MSAASNSKASQRRWAALVLVLVGCHGADVEPEVMDAGTDSPPVAIVCTPDGPSSAVLLHTFDEGPTRELLLAGPDLVFLDGTVFRQSADEWARGRDLGAIQVQGDLLLTRDQADFSVYLRHPDGGLEWLARHELDDSGYHYTVAGRLDGDRLVMSGHTAPRINVRERWQDPLAEPVVHETDAVGTLALEGDWLANGGRGVIEVRRRSTDGRWWSTRQTIPTRGRDFVLNHGRLIAGGIDLEGRSAVFVHHLDVDERWQRVQVLHADAFDPSEPATEGDGFGTVVRVAGDRLAVGGGRASFCGETWERRGAVFLYREVDGRWVFEQVVLPPPEETTSNFGAALDFDGRRLLVGDPPSYGGETERVFLYDVGE